MIQYGYVFVLVDENNLSHQQFSVAFVDPSEDLIHQAMDTLLVRNRSLLQQIRRYFGEPGA